MSASRIAEPWKSFLHELDNAASGEVRLHCIGGFVMTQLYGLQRPTADVDVLQISPGGEKDRLIRVGGKGSELHKRFKVYLELVAVVTPPEDFEDRLVEMLAGRFRCLRLYALEAHDLALTKLERNIQRDREDVKHLARSGRITLETLRERYEGELRPHLANPAREDLTLRLWIDAIQEDLRR